MRSGLLLAVALVLSIAATPTAWAKQLPPAFGTELKADDKDHEASEPAGAAELEDRKPSKQNRPAFRPQRVGKGGRVKIQLDGDEDGGGDYGSDAGSDPDAGDF